MDRGFTAGQTVQIMRGCSLMTSKMGRESMNGVTGGSIKDSLRMTWRMEKALRSGPMGGSTWEISIAGRRMGRENLPGQKVASTKEVSSMIRSQAKAF